MLSRLNRWWDQWRTTADEWSTRCLQHPFEPASSAKPLTLSGLEPRILFSATPIDLASLPGGDESAATVATVEIDEESTTSSESEITASTLAEQSPGEVIIIDAGVPDLQQLLDDLSRSGRDADVFVLDAEQDGVEQITEILDSRSEIDSIHLISHSEDGGVRLGNLWLSETNLDGYAGQIATWQSSLSGDADILLYGCDLAADPSGRTLVDSISALTGADVAASSDDTGHAKYGGNWELEYHVGEIESAVVFSSDLQASWEHKLATLTVTTFADVMDNGDGLLSLREAIIQSNSGGGGDTIVLSSGTYTLSIAGNGEDAAAAGDLDINQDVTITGAGASTTIDASGMGDRVFHVRSGTTVMSDLKITGGQEGLGGAIKVETATLQLSDVEIFGNHATTNGGGIHSTGTLTLERVTIAENTADTNAGGIYIANNSTATLTNVTISGNDGNLGGGIFNANGDVTMINCTIANNSSGIATSGSHTTELKNTILDNIGANADQPLTSLGNNLDTDGTAFPGSPLEGADPLLGVLADNGGVGRTHAITTSSPAYNAGMLAGAPATDQRGTTRDAAPDIGAYEFDSTIVLNSVQDTYISADDKTFNYGGSSVLVVDASSGNQGDIRTLLEFDFASIPVGATITGATLLLEATFIDNPLDVNVYELLESWTEGSGTGTVGVGNWDDREAGTAWTDAGGTIDPTIVSTFSASTTGQHSWDITTLVQAWVSGSKVNHGLLLGSEDGGSATVSYSSREGSTAPQLVIEYVANGTPAADAGGPYAINEGEAVSLVGGGSSDPDGDPLSFAWDLDNDGIFGEAGEPTTVSPTVTWATLQSFGIGDDGVHTIGLRVDDGRGGISDTTTTLTVNNVGPTGNADSGAGFTTDEDTAFTTANVLANDSDPNSSDVLSVSGIDLTGTVGLVIDNGDGTFDYDPNGQFESLGVGQQATDTFTYFVSDDDGGSSSAVVTITINGRNDAPTDITLDNNNVAENAAGAVIGNVAVVDADAGDTHTWSVDDVRFEIVGGQLKLKAGQSLDFETEPTVNLTITVTDQGGGGLSYNEAFVINVTGVNEAPTDITLDNNNVAENAAGAVIGNVAVVDPDAGDTHTWSVDDVRFEIVGGQLKLKAGQSLDFETEPTVNLTITVTDQGGGGLSYNEAFVINVTGVNEAPTDITLDNNNVAENAAGAVIGNVGVVDPDAGDTHTWSVDDARFEIVGGQLKLKAGQSLDFETEPTVNLTITVTDQGGGLSYNEAFVVNVTDDNEAPTDITLDSTNVSEQTDGAIVGNVGVVDPDAGDTHTWTVDDVRFEIVGGQLKLKAGQTLDKIAEPTVNVTITVTDQGGGGLSYNEAFVLTVDDVNQAPTDIDLDNNNVAENAAGAVIGNVTVVDPDVGDTHALTVDDVRFEIVGGQLRLKAGQSLDFETEPTVNITITATDQAGGGLSYNEAFVINVSNVNEAPVAIDDNHSGANEGALYNRGVPGVLSNDTDPDLDTLDAILVSGPSFATTFVLNVDGSYSYQHDGSETTTDTFTYRVWDGNLFSNVATVTLTIAPTNDAPTDITLDNTNVNENTAGAIIGNLGVVDPDIGDTHSWSVDDTRFEIVGTQLKLKAGQSLDSVAEPTVSLTITATDQGGAGLAYNEVFVITVSNVNEAPTDITLSNANVNENSPGAVIGTLGVVDPDPVDVHIGSVNDTRFEIIGSTLKLKTGQSLDFEAGGTVNVTITVTDQGGTGLSYSEVFTITVNNVNEAPIADTESYAVFAGNTLTAAAPGVIAGDFDPDGDNLTAGLQSGPANGTLTFSADGSFTYTPDAGFVGTDSFIYQASDGSLSSAPTLVTITVAPAVIPLPPTPDGGDGDGDEPEPPPVPEDDPDPKVESDPPIVVDDGPINPGTGGQTPTTRSGTPVERAAVPAVESPEFDRWTADTDLGGERNAASFASVISSSLRGNGSATEELRSRLEDIFQISVFGSQWQSLDSFREELLSDDQFETLVVGAAVGAAVAASVGQAVWLLRAGYMASTLMSTMPIWRTIDPLPVLEYLEDDQRQPADKESLQSIIEQGKKSQDVPSL